MLQTTQSLTISGQSVINGKPVLSFSANISQDGGSNNINQSVLDQSLYENNIEAARKDAADFQELIYSTEDKMLSEAKPSSNSESR
ncbi:hypothetical protein [Lacticaseibacillus saniviri]